VFVINPNGILVGPSGQIDTKGFIASTLDIPNASFMSGNNLIFSGNSTAAVRNEGSIRALGGTAKDNVTRKTAYLVLGDDPGANKLERARALGTEQINEEQFLAILEQKD
jgi:NAD-dependent DNA ligase